MNAVRAAFLLIFDCDGVLVDSEPTACAEVEAQLCALGLPIQPHEIADRYVGLSASSMYADLEARHGRQITAAERAAIDRAVDERLASTVEAMPGVTQAVAEISACCAICVASSGTPGRIRGSLARAGLWSAFEGQIFSAIEVPRGKPAPDLFWHAARQMGYSPERCLVLEDSVAGVTAAAAAGMFCIGFVGGSHVREGHADALLRAGARAIAFTMREVPSLALQTLRGGLIATRP
jgi:HAD superfamily hydrolase (TIGR01509 family)